MTTTYSLVATEQHAASMLSALTRLFWRGPRARLLVLGSFAVGAGVTVLVGRGPLVLGQAVLGGVGLAGLLAVLVTLRLRRAVRQALARGWYAGSVHETVFEEDSVTTRGPAGAVQLRYVALGAVEQHGDVVVLRQRGPGAARGGVVSPAELFPPEEQERIRRALSGRRDEE